MFYKKFYQKLLMGLLLMAFMAPPAQADELTVAEGSATSYYVPISGYYLKADNYSQVIYPSSMFSDSELPGNQITGLKWYYASAPGFVCDVIVNIGTSASATNASTTPLAGLTKVYEGPVTVSGSEVSIEFDDPYSYDGNQNLVIEVKVKTATTKGGYIAAQGLTGSSGSSMYLYSSSWGNTSNYGSFIPKTTFTYESAVSEPYAAKVTPASLAFGKKATGSTTSMNVTLKNTGANPFTPSVTVSGTGFSTTYTATELASKASATIPVAFAPTTPGDFSGTLTVDCGNGIEVFNIPLTGNAANELPVSDGTATSSYLPVYGNWYDANNGQINQMIYPASMLAALDGKKITSMTFYSQSTTFFSGGSVTFSLGNLPVETATFSSAERITTDDLTQVYSDVPTVAQEWTITFPSDVDFIYNGGNLLLDVVTTKGTYKDVQFYGTDGHTNASWNSYNNGNANLRDFLPKVTFAYEDVAVDPVYSLEVTDPTTGSIDFGTVNVGQSGTATVTIKNTGNTAVTPVLSTSNGCFTVTSDESGELAKKATRTYTITFAPTEETDYNATLTVADTDGFVTVAPTVTLTGVGHALAAYDVAVSEESGVHNFGDVFKDGVATWNVTLSNNGANAVTPVIEGLAAPFSAENVPATIATGESATITFKFAPTAIQAYGPTSIVVKFAETTDFQFDYTFRGNGIEDTGTLPPSFYDGITYKWTDSEGVEHTSKLSDVATDPDQMIALMREVYTNKSLPGPYYRGYDASGNVETAYPVAYPAIGTVSRFGTFGEVDNYTYDGETCGWNIPHNEAEYPFELLYHNSSSHNYYKALNANEYKPDKEGLTLLLVEMKDGVTSSTVSNTASLRNVFSGMFKSVRVIPNSKRVTKNGVEGTLFKIDCDKMNRFFFLGKGRLRLYNDAYVDNTHLGRSNFFIDKDNQTSSSLSITNVFGDNGDKAPFYEMFEQFSPVSLTQGTEAEDIYQELINMASYPVEHDCEYIPWASASSTSGGGSIVGHEFNMYGKASLSEDCQDVRDLMFFVPDQRMKYWDSRDKGGNDKFVNYYEEMAPTMGLYVIRQNEITGEKKTFEGNENNYELHLTWDSNLTDFVPADKGVYYIYQVNDDGTYTLVGTTNSQTKELYVNVAMQSHGQQVTYVIQGQDNTQFLSLQMSNEESFIIPGTDPNEIFQLDPNADIWSRFDPAQEINFYANGMQIKAYPGVATSTYAGKTLNYYRKAVGETEWTLVGTAAVNSGATQATVSMVPATQRQQSEYKYGYQANESAVDIAADAHGFNVFGIIYDNFKASVEGNNHPDYYNYKVEVAGEAAHSNEITIRIYKTAMSTIAGTFTYSQVEADENHQLGLKSTAFDIDVQHSSKTEILRYDAYRWPESADYAIIDQTSPVDDEQDFAPNGIAGNQGEYYTVAMNSDYVGENVPVAQGQISQATFEDSYPEANPDAYVYAPVVETFTGRGDYNTYGAPLQSTATGLLTLTPGTIEAPDYTFTTTADGRTGEFTYYTIPLGVTVDIPTGFDIYKVRAWRQVDMDVLGEEKNSAYTGRRVADYLFETNSDTNVVDFTQVGETEDGTQHGAKVYTGTFGARKVTGNDSFDANFIVRVYFTRNDNLNTGSKAADGKYYIAEAKTTVTVKNVIYTGVNDVDAVKEVAGVKYYNLAGMESNEPFSGVNIIVTRYTDGSISTSKVMR